jgi:hypothetical protein
MQNGLTAKQTKRTKNQGSFFWTNHFARRKEKNLNRDGRQNKPSIVSWVAFGCDDLIAGLSEELCESSTLTRKEP